MKVSGEALGVMVAFTLLRTLYTPSYKWLTQSAHPFTLNIWMSVVTIAVTLAMLKGKLKKFSKLKDKRYFLGVYTLSILGGLMLNLSIMYLEVKAFALMTAFIPLAVSFYSDFFNKERPSLTLWLATLVVVTGAAIFKTAGAIEFGLGDVFVAAGILVWSIGPNLTRKYVRTLGRRELLATSAMVSVPISAALAVATGQPILLPFDTRLLLAFAAFAVFINLGTNYLSAWAMKHVPSYIFVVITTALVPVGAILWGMSFFGESMSTREIVGGAVMLAGATAAVLRGK